MTGADRGIGFATARELGARGYTVLLGARDGQKGMQAEELMTAEGIAARSIRLDVTDQESIDAAAALVDRDYGSLDILVNNAGIFLDGELSPSQVEVSILKRTFDTNFFGMFAVTRTLLPLLAQSSAGRIVNVTSSLGSMALQGASDSQSRVALSYVCSKSAVNMMTILLAKELRGTKIKINAACPGYTATDLNGFKGKRSVQQASVIIVRLATLDEAGPTGGYFNEDGPIPW